MDKKPYLKQVAELARSSAKGGIELYNIGDMMYAEGKDVRPGRILDLPASAGLELAAGPRSRMSLLPVRPTRTSS